MFRSILYEILKSPTERKKLRKTQKLEYSYAVVICTKNGLRRAPKSKGLNTINSEITTEVAIWRNINQSPDKVSRK